MSALPSHIGAYEVVRLLGKGGMAVVYLGRDPAIDRHVAIKLLRESLDSSELRERFSREARSAGRLRHPNIVTVFQVGVHDNAPFIVMEYIPGESLAEVIRRQPPLPLTWKLRVIEDLCRGLAYAHKSGVVHRDMKPANIQIDSDGGVKILDFGIARLGEQKTGEQALTRLGMMMGTPNYMAPEQINPGTADHRSDVFAVGLVFYELLTYRRAFGGDSYAVLHNILHQEPESIDRIVPDIDPDVIAIVNRALAKDPEARYQDLAEMRDDIKRIRLRLRSQFDDGADEGPVTIGSHTLVESDATRLADRRTEISRFLDAAKSAYDSSEFHKALDLCRRALDLDPSSREALDLRSRAAGELALVQARDLLAAGQEAFAAGSLEEALAHIKEVEALELPVDGGATVQAQVSALARAVSTATERQNLLRERLERARELLGAGALDGSAQAVDSALAVAPGNRDALALRTEIRAAIDAERARQRAAEDAIAEARLHAEAGRYDDAVHLLERHQPPHSAVSAALDDIRAEQAEAQERAAAERRRKDHAEQAARTLDAARHTAERGDLAAALAQVASIDFRDPAVASPALDRVRAEVDAFAARCEAGQHLDAAREALAAEDLTAAATNLERARQRDSQHPAAASVAAALDRAKTIHDRVGRARKELEAGNLDTAERLVSEALALGPDHRDAVALHDRVRAAVADRETARQRAADDAVTAARREAERGNFSKAIAALKSHRPSHPVVAAALADITEQQAAAEKRAADERRRQDHASRARTALKAARAAADHGDPAAALLLLQGIQFDGADVRSPALDELRAEADALVARCEAGEHLRTARAEVVNGNRQAAEDALERARQRDQSHPDLEDVAALLAGQTVLMDRSAMGVDASPDPATMYLSRSEGTSAARAAGVSEDDVSPATLVQPHPASPTQQRDLADGDRTVVLHTSPAAAVSAAAAPAVTPASGRPEAPRPQTAPAAAATAQRPAASVPKRGTPMPLIGAAAAAAVIAIAAIWWVTSGPADSNQIAEGTPTTTTRPAPTPPVTSTPNGSVTTPSSTQPRSTQPPATQPPPTVQSTTPGATPTRTTPPPPSVTTQAPTTPVARGATPPGRAPATPSSTQATVAPPPQVTNTNTAAPTTPGNTLPPPVTPVAEPPVAEVRPTPPPVRPPEPAAERPPAPDPARDEAAIRDTLAQYTNGYQRLDAAAIRRVWPSAPANLPQSFQDVRSYSVQLQNPQITLRGDTATVTAVRRIRSQPTAGRALEASLATTFSLRRAGNGWVIDSIR